MRKLGQGKLKDITKDLKIMVPHLINNQVESVTIESLGNMAEIRIRVYHPKALFIVRDPDGNLWREK